MLKLLILLSATTLTALLSIAAHADRTYTPAQLNRLVNSGNPPPQGPITTTTQSIDFASCVAKIESIAAAIGSHYPTYTVVKTNIMRVEKFWTNDAAMTATCVAADRKLVLTTAKYL